MKYLLLCHHCGNREFTDGTSLPPYQEVKTAPLPARADGKSKETVKLPKRYKCPKCGYLFEIVKTETTAPKEIESNKDAFFQDELPPLK